MSRPIDPRNIEVVDSRVAEILRSKTMAERIAMIGDANDAARILAANGIRQQHSEWSEIEVQQEVARLMLSGEIEDIVCRP